MIIKRIIPYLITGVLLVTTICAVSTGRKNDPVKPDKATDDEPTAEEMRAVWVTYMTLDVENESDKEAAFYHRIDQIVERMQTGGFNTVFVHVRPFCDAIYPSAYYPWSHIISGTQGEDPGFDPLEIICDKCKKAGISVHAWINPYRVSTQQTPTALCSENPYQRDPTLGVTVNGETYLNFADKRVRELIVSGVIELIENYDIDGIQFDDYFYPEDGGDFDAEEYETYLASTDTPLSKEEFRKENINQLIREVYHAVHQTDSRAVFGISPQGNLPNNEVISADVVRWCTEEGYVDYICPQLYFSLDNPALRFEDALEQWISTPRHPKLRLYIGLAGYKAGSDADDGTWLDNSDVLKTEVQILRKAGANGFALYSYDSLLYEESRSEIENLIGYLTVPTQ